MKKLFHLLVLLLLSTLNPMPRRNQVKAGQRLAKGACLIAFFLLSVSTVFAQGAAFTYQGRLTDGANPAQGIYDLRFTIYDAVGGGSVWGVLTNAATPVTNGLFTVTLDFGSGVFNGSARWLDIGVRTNGGGAFASLYPRQPILPTPYAIYAANAGSAAAAATADALASTNFATQWAGIAATGAVATASTAVTATNAYAVVDPSGTNWLYLVNMPTTNIIANLDYTRLWVTNTGITGEDGWMYTNATIGAFTNSTGHCLGYSADGLFAIGAAPFSGMVSANYDYDSSPQTGSTNDITLLNGICCGNWAPDNGSSTTVLTCFPTNSITTNILSHLSYIFDGTSAAAANLNWYQNVTTLGVTNDGITDITVPLQALLSVQGGNYYFPEGRYLAQELVITNNVSITGPGILVYANNAQNNKVFIDASTCMNISITSIGIDGVTYTNNPNPTFVANNGSTTNFSSPDNFGAFNPTGVRIGLKCNAGGRGTIAGIKISRFSGIGLYPISINTTPQSTDHPIIFGVNICSNFCGLFSSAFAVTPEYMNYYSMSIHNNTVGVVMSAGNHNFFGSTVTENQYGLLDTGGRNNCHGNIIGVLFNHNTVMALGIYGAEAGEQINTCQFRGNTGANVIMIARSAGVVVDDCSLDLVSVTNVNTPPGGQNFFRNNTYFGTWASYSNVFYTDGHLDCSGNKSADHAGDNDGQPFTLVSLGNAGGLTNLNASQLSGGTISLAQLPGAVVTNTETGVTLSGTFTGNGGGLTNLAANAIVGGLTTNFAVLVPGGGTNTLCFTNGVLRAVQ